MTTPNDAIPQLGVSLPTWPLSGGRNAGWSEIRSVARDLDALGFDTLWAADHLQRRVADRPPFGFWECWTILAAAAETTERISLGPFVANTGFRNPGLLARMAATLDEVSGGRVILGLGAGVPATDASWTAFGFEQDRHVARHAEAVELVATLLREPPVTLDGQFYTTVGADVLPRGPRDRIPIWVAAKGPRTLRIAARWADAVNVNVPLAGAADADAIVRDATAACVGVDRDPATLDVTGWARLALRPDGTAESRPGWIGGSPAEVGETLREMRGVGVRHLTLYLGDVDDPSPLPAVTRTALERFEPFLAALRGG
jgi:alkanesulfonate monooxygenase SsuD/methylene tetrahydromethanopterin reductase-like flavin-dependent oxidoreductase (luciferase family)